MDGGPGPSEVLRRIPSADWLRAFGAALLVGGLASFVVPWVGVLALALLGGAGAMVVPWRAAKAHLIAHPTTPAPQAPTSAERYMRALKTVGDFRDQANRWYLSEEAMPSVAWTVLRDEILDWANASLKPECAERLAAVIEAASPTAPTSDNRRNAGALVGSLLEFQRSLTSPEVL